MKKQKITKKWYSTLIVLLLIGFMIVLTSWIFRLVIKEMKSNKILWDYIKAYAWAEAAQELALLEIKKKWYWYDINLGSTKKDWKYEWKATIISKFIAPSSYNPVRDVLLSYSNDWRTDVYEWNIPKLWYDIIPLFYISDSENLEDIIENKINKIKLNVIEWVSSDLSWNIIGLKSWISWIWNFLENTSGAMKYTENNQFAYSNKTIEEFLQLSDTNYLVLFNSWKSSIRYNLNWEWWYFTKPRLNITSSWEVWDFRQNINTKVDNTEFLSILKYSIFSEISTNYTQKP